MAVKIRMQRNGRHKQASYRIVVADSRYPRDGRFIEILGHYDPTTTPATLKLDADKAYEWIKKGAQPSDTVRTFLSQTGVLKRIHEETFKKGN
jgi:small subunit ribosomal protein S16